MGVLEIKVLVKEKIAEAGVQALKGAGFDVDVRPDMEADELLQKIGDYDGLIVRGATKVTADVIAAGKNLKIIGRAGIGVDNIDVEAATKQGVVVANAPASNIISVAEHAIALMLSLCRYVPAADASMKAGMWEKSKFEGTEVDGKTLGVVGLGRIGTLVAGRARGLGMRVLGYDPYVSSERFAHLGVEPAESLEALLKEADVITIHLPRTKETAGLIGKKQLAICKDGVRIVNTARGAAIDEAALVEALKSGKVAGAGLDVYGEEPYKGPLTGMDSVVLTPHIAASTQEAQDKAGTQIADQVVAGLKGDFVSNAINIPVVSPESLDALKPFMPLAEVLGKFFTHLSEGQLEGLEVEFAGQISEYDTKLLTVGVLKGMLESVSDEPVNYVNALSLAAERGTDVRESKTATSRDYVNLLTVTSTDKEGKVSAGATLVGPKNQQRLVSIYDFDIDMVPSQYMAFFRYEDRPGMIGKVGTILGDNGINIGNMQVGRKVVGGEALMGINLDSVI